MQSLGSPYAFIGALALSCLTAGCVADPIDEEEDGIESALAPNQREVFSTADTFVRSGSFAGTKYGSATFLDADLDSSGTQKITYLRFAVPVVTFASAKLRLYVNQTSPDGADLKGVSRTDFAEGITWNTRPAIDGATFGTLQSAVTGWTEVDVTAAVKSGQPIAFAVVARSSNGVRFASDEAGARGPRLLLTLSSTTGGGTPTTVTAVRADAFVDSIGVCTHLGWGGTIWDTRFSQYAPMIGEAGFRYVRTTANAVSKPKLAFLHSSYGVRANILFNARNADDTLDNSSIPGALAFIRDQIGVSKVIALEGANEYNDSRATNPNWATQLRSYQTALYTAAKADAQLKVLPVLAPTIWKRIIEDYQALGNLDAVADLANLHYYTGGRKPTVAGSTGPGEITLDTAIGYSKITVPSAPTWVTETGYNNIADTVDSPYAVPEPTAAKYILRLLAETFMRNGPESKSFLYSLLDDPAKLTHEYGLLRTDLSRKPAYYAVKNAIRLLADPGAPFTPDALEYTITGDMTDVHHVVTQKRDGRFYLLIWLDAVSYDRKTATELDVPARPLRLDVSSHGFSKAVFYQPTAVGLTNPNLGVNPTGTVTAPTVIDVLVPDHVLVIELAP